MFYLGIRRGPSCFCCLFYNFSSWIWGRIVAYFLSQYRWGKAATQRGQVHHSNVVSWEKERTMGWWKVKRSPKWASKKAQRECVCGGEGVVSKCCVCSLEASVCYNWVNMSKWSMWWASGAGENCCFCTYRAWMNPLLRAIISTLLLHCWSHNTTEKLIFL